MLQGLHLLQLRGLLPADGYSCCSVPAANAALLLLYLAEAITEGHYPCRTTEGCDAVDEESSLGLEYNHLCLLFGTPSP